MISWNATRPSILFQVAKRNSLRFFARWRSLGGVSGARLRFCRRGRLGARHPGHRPHPVIQHLVGQSRVAGGRTSAPVGPIRNGFESSMTMSSLMDALHEH